VGWIGKIPPHRDNAVHSLFDFMIGAEATDAIAASEPVVRAPARAREGEA
jgi:hypothetical protein